LCNTAKPQIIAINPEKNARNNEDLVMFLLIKLCVNWHTCLIGPQVFFCGVVRGIFLRK